jgi:hypothetical protein
MGGDEESVKDIKKASDCEAKNNKKEDGMDPVKARRQKMFRDAMAGKLVCIVKNMQ